MTVQTVDELQRVVIKEELLALTGKHFDAALLNNLIFWAGIVEKMDNNLQTQIRQLEARNAKQTVIDKKKKQLRNGWFYKTGEELLAELMGWGSASTISRAIDGFVKNSWMEKGNNPDPAERWDRTKWYRVNLVKIAADLQELGYALEGYSLVQEQPQTEEKPSGPAPLPILQDEKCSLQDETSSLQDERTIPEGLLQKGTSEKDFEEEEVLPTVTEMDVIHLMNAKVKERGITNQKTITAIFDVVTKCKAIGTTDRAAAENYVITIVEEKMQKFGQKQKAAKPHRSKQQPTRKEMLPQWLEQQKEPEQATAAAPVDLEEQRKIASILKRDAVNMVNAFITGEESAEVKEQRRKLEEALKQYKKE